MAIRIYGKQNCIYCLSAKDLCERKGIEYEYIDIFNDLTEGERNHYLNVIVPGIRSVPQIFNGWEHIGGFDKFKEWVNAHHNL